MWDPGNSKSVSQILCPKRGTVGPQVVEQEVRSVPELESERLIHAKSVTGSLRRGQKGRKNCLAAIIKDIGTRGSRVRSLRADEGADLADSRKLMSHKENDARNSAKCFLNIEPRWRLNYL